MKIQFEIVELPEQPALTIRDKVPFAEVPASMGRSFGEIAIYMSGKGIPFAGNPFAIYHSWDATHADMEVGFPVPPGSAGEGRIRLSSLPGGRVVTGLFVGPYDKLSEGYKAMQAWIKERGLVPSSKMWEVYMTDPKVEPDLSKHQTRMYWPIA